MTPVHEIGRQLRDLRSLRDRLVGTMRTAASTLQDQGRPPAAGLMDDLTTYRRWFAEIRSALHPVPATTNHGVESLDGLEQSLQVVQSIQAAGGVLERVLKLDHQRPDQRALLHPIHQVAQATLARFQTPDSPAYEEAQRLLTPAHPLAVLLNLVEQPESLSDSDWERSLEVLRAEFLCQGVAEPGN